MKDIKPFILNKLKNLQSKNSNNGENNHRIVAVFNLQCFLYDVWKQIGGKLGMKNLIFDFVENRFVSTSTITEYLPKKEYHNPSTTSPPPSLYLK
jgi:hypothetical protein